MPLITRFFPYPTCFRYEDSRTVRLGNEEDDNEKTDTRENGSHPEYPSPALKISFIISDRFWDVPFPRQRCIQLRWVRRLALRTGQGRRRLFDVSVRTMEEQGM
jgi:hypothetical protein